MRVRGSDEVRASTLAAAAQTRDDWAGHFAVLENDRIRITPLPPPD